MTGEEKRRPQRRDAGWLATAAGALVLVALGFGVGLVAGTAYQEPDLVAAHLAGRTVEVPLVPQAKPAPAADVAAAPPEEPPAAAPPTVAEPPPKLLGAGALRAAASAPSEPAAGAPEAKHEGIVARAAPHASPAPALHHPSAPPAPQSTKAAAKRGGYSIQVGAFATESAAQQLAHELGKRGYHSYVAYVGGGARYKVRVGPVASRAEAEQISARLKSQHRLPTWILAEKS